MMDIWARMTKRGRPAKPRSKTVWIPEELIELVTALKNEDLEKATIHFARWVDGLNKPDVN